MNRIGGKRVSRDAAKMMMDVAIRSIAEQNAVLIEIRPLCTEEEFREYRRMIGKSMGAMLFEIINPIVGKYPELKPDQLK
jgi:hypothetical protein